MSPCYRHRYGAIVGGQALTARAAPSHLGMHAEQSTPSRMHQPPSRHVPEGQPALCPGVIGKKRGLDYRTTVERYLTKALTLPVRSPVTAPPHS
jgi:hypothetical protein